MKKVLLLFTAFLAMSCGSLDELGKDVYTVTPKPLEVHGGNVKIDMNATFGPKIFPKDVTVEITPILLSLKKYEGKRYKSVVYQGEQFPGNNESIPYEKGKSVSYSGEVSYLPSMESSSLYAYVVAKRGEKAVDFPPIKLAKGVIVTSLLVNKKDVRTVIAQDKYQKVTSYKKAGAINFLKNSSVVRNQELTESDFKDISNIIVDASKNDKITIKAIYLDGYASPEGEITLNENLANDRASKVYEKLKEIFTKTKLSKQKLKDISIVEKGHGADWNTFNSKLDNSDIKDKDVIKRSIEEKISVSEKEKALSTISNAYAQVEEILSAIRRSEIVVEYEVIAKSDEEIQKLLNTDISKLTEEEIVYGANKLLSNSEEKLNVYLKMIEKYPSDYRGFNNSGALYFEKGDLAKAKEMFTKAYELEKNEIISSNLAAIYILERKFAESYQLLSNVSLSESKYNKGIMQIMLGEYQNAVNNMQGINTFNLALAKLLNKDFEGCLATLDAGSRKGGMDYYLRAIANMRLGKKEETKKMLDMAEEKQKGLMERAKHDLEFDGLFQLTSKDIQPEELKKRIIESHTSEVENLKGKFEAYQEDYNYGSDEIYEPKDTHYNY